MFSFREGEEKGRKSSSILGRLVKDASQTVEHRGEDERTQSRKERTHWPAQKTRSASMLNTN